MRPGTEYRLRDYTAVTHSVDQLLDSLPMTQRVVYYRQLAQDALYQAGGASNQAARGGLLSMAAGWHMLASELERAMTRTVDDGH